MCLSYHKKLNYDSWNAPWSVAAKYKKNGFKIALFALQY